ncbi:MAG: GNAT family N-acetyltransferase [Phycisphaerales bacterium]
MAPRIRHAALADTESIADAHLAGWMAAYRGVLDDAFLSTLDHARFVGYSRPRLENPEQGNAFLVAEFQGSIAGFTRAGPTRTATPTGDPLPDGFTQHASAELYAIYLQPSAFGTGVGAALLAAAAKEMLSFGHKAMCVWVLTDNTRALQWYKRRGAVPIAEAPITLGGVQYPQTALLWRDLRPLAADAGHT